MSVELCLWSCPELFRGVKKRKLSVLFQPWGLPVFCLRTCFWNKHKFQNQVILNAVPYRQNCTSSAAVLHPSPLFLFSVCPFLSEWVAAWFHSLLVLCLKLSLKGFGGYFQKQMIEVMLRGMSKRTTAWFWLILCLVWFKVLSVMLKNFKES